MNAETGKGFGQPVQGANVVACSTQLQREFQHLQSNWRWLLILGILLAVCGTLAIISPAMTVMATLVATILLGATLIVAGIATIAASFWVGKWGGLLVQLLVGLLYVVVGWIIIDTPLRSAGALTLFMAVFFIITGLFRIVAATVMQFTYWGWALLNGIVTFLLGVIIYHHYPQSTLWALGLLVGLEMLFHGWTWIMLALAVRRLPTKAD